LLHGAPVIGEKVKVQKFLKNNKNDKNLRKKVRAKNDNNGRNYSNRLEIYVTLKSTHLLRMPTSCSQMSVGDNTSSSTPSYIRRKSELSLAILPWECRKVMKRTTNGLRGR